MSYYQLGISCTPQTIAYTSNHKFFPLHASIYRRQNNHILQLPCNSISKSMLNIHEKEHEKTLHDTTTCRTCNNKVSK